MTRTQKIWLYAVIILASLHLLRDILQDAGVKVFISTAFVKQPSNVFIATLLWTFLNTYVTAFLEIILSIYCLKKNKFGIAGWLTIAIAIVATFGWIVYWFYL